MKELPKQVYTLLNKKFNIIDVISFLEFDQDFDLLKSRLLNLKKESFDANDRIVIEHLDTDFYFEHCSVGINLLNFFNTIKDIDFPNFVFLFYTNHFGIEKEINAVCKDPYDRPGVIESFISDIHYSPGGYQDIELNADAVSHQLLCMMNMIRSHRSVMFNSLKDLPSDSLITAITVNRNAT
jgi:hypothetical protein